MSDQKEKPKPKKRGRKKKCELHVKDRKISGFLKNSNTIDVIHGNSIVVNGNNTNDHNNDDEFEEQVFGNIKIYKKKKKEEKKISLNLNKETVECDNQLVTYGHHNTSIINKNAVSISNGVGINTDCQINLDIIKPQIETFKTKKVKKKRNNIFTRLRETSSIEHFKNDRVNPTQKIKPISTMTILHVYGNTVKRWPVKSDLLCWWCCHSFDTAPCFIPTNYDEHGNRFKVQGNFCSWNCVLAHILQLNSKNLAMYRFHKLMNQLKLRSYKIKPAPKKEVLDSFGGSVSIKEYRDSFYTNTNYKFISSPMELNHDYRTLKFYT